MIFPSPASAVKDADRSPKMLRTDGPDTGTPPMVMRSTWTPSVTGSRTHSDAGPERSASGRAARNFSRNSASVSSTVL